MLPEYLPYQKDVRLYYLPLTYEFVSLMTNNHI